MKRRKFISNSTIDLTGVIFAPNTIKSNIPITSFEKEFPYFTTRKLTSGPKNHFFGYYGMSPWNYSETKMVCLESSFHHRLPNPNEKAEVGIVDPEIGAFTPIAETLAWNLQQGSLLPWNPINPDQEIIYNYRIGKHLGAVYLNVNTCVKSILPRQISAFGNNGHYALSLTYGRLSSLRKVVGYADAKDPYADQAHPKKDGIFLMDMKTEAVLSIGRFPDPEEFTKDWRCDIHCRWSPNGDIVGFNSTHSGSRQIYLLHLKFPK